MTKYHDLPIFCDNCPALAMAELDTAPLCEKCLLRAVNRSTDLEIAERIEPLKFNVIPLITRPFETSVA
jgi:hypothetical protein